MQPAFLRHAIPKRLFGSEFNIQPMGASRMNPLVCVVWVFTILEMSSVARAMSDADCAAAFTRADTNGDGVITDLEGPRYFSALRVAKVLADVRLNRAAFLEHCKSGLFDAKAEAGAPFAGVNLITESQAQDRATASGLTNVSALKLDDKGIWRGTANDASKTVGIAIDYRGNVVTN
jgi:hypothetical protein